MTALVQRSALEQLDIVAARLEEIRVAEGLTLREAGRILGMLAGNIHSLRTRARTSQTLPTLDAYACHLGYRLHVVLVEDDPGQRRPPWRERMPHGDNAGDAQAMSELWQLLQHLHMLRQKAGLTRDEVAETLGISPLTLWRLENNPGAADAAFTNVLLYSRFYGYTVQFHLAEPLEVTAIGKWMRDDGSVIYDGNPETGDDEDHPDDE
ncbi:helix-turn-helix domain-containing protein [Amycolatopsis sp. NPDC005232]|uniref:helix-turn-helix domain-containing protein n=1 Tax=Amycolatopsis sp. NPDC005232 TaxID=3157027 RepID=UPI00339F8BCD